MPDDSLIRFTAHRIPAADLRALMERSNRPALVRALWHLGVLAITSTLVWRFRGTAWVVPLLVVHGYVLAFMFCAFHEAAHRTAFRARQLNVMLGTLAGILIFWPYQNYRVFHWQHHRYTQDPARDPELYFRKPTSLGSYLFALTGIPNFIRRTADILRLARGRADRPWMAPAERPTLIVEARVHLMAYALIAMGSVAAGTPVLLLVWILPLLIGQVFLRPYLLAEHTGCALTRDCLDNTRTTLTLALVRLFAWNMPYHAEHHAYPAVPFHALPRLHDHVRGKIANLEPGYIAATIAVNRFLFRGERTGLEQIAER